MSLASLDLSLLLLLGCSAERQELLLRHLSQSPCALLALGSVGGTARLE